MARQVGRLDWFGAYGFIYHLDGRMAARVDRSGFDGAGGSAPAHKSMVTFAATRVAGHTHPLAQGVRLLADETDAALLLACFQSPDKEIWPLAATRYLSTMPAQEALDIARAKLAETDDPLLLLYRIPPRVLLLPDARDVREKFPVDDRLALYESFLDLGPFKDEIAGCLAHVLSHRHDRLWRRLLADEHDPERLRAHFLSANSSEWQAVATRYLASLSSTDALAAIRAKLESVHKASIVLPHVPAPVLSLPDARDVRIGMPAGRRLKLLSTFENLDAHADEIAETLARASSDSVSSFWKQVSSRVAPGSALDALMPKAAPVVEVRDVSAEPQPGPQLRPAGPLAFKPDMADAARRWAAFFAGEMIDRPIVHVTAPRDGMSAPQAPTYRDRVFGDIDDVVDRALRAAEATYWGGDAIPSFMPSFGPDEIAVFCGTEFGWSDDSGDTNWSKPFVKDWAESLPLRIQEDHPLWQRMLALCRRAAERMAGKMLVMPLDLHSNMDLLAAARGPQQLCLDLIEQPEMIDRAMQDARAVFPVVWRGVAEAARMDELGYTHLGYAPDGMAFLQCDFSCMISPAMFRRWVLPALEEEAEIVKHNVYHWDGPGALVHTDDLIQSRGLKTLSFVPGDGNGSHVKWIDLLKRVQAGGKAVHVWGTPDEMKILHRELRPDKVMYVTSAQSQAEADELVEWFVKNT